MEPSILQMLSEVLSQSLQRRANRAERVKFCPTLKMSHALGWRDSCSSTRRDT